MYKLIAKNGDHMECSFPSMGALLHCLNNRDSDIASKVRSTTDQWLVRHESQQYPLENAMGDVFPVVKTAPSYVLFADWINELHILATDGGRLGRAKLPCEMMAGEWGAVQAVHNAMFSGMSTRTGSDTYNYTHQTQLERMFFDKFGYGFNGPVYNGSDTNGRHVVQVAYALAKGQPVPQEVIDGYLTYLEGGGFDVQWFAHLLKKPFLRGQFQAETLSSLVMLLGGNGKKSVDELTQDNLARIKTALAPYGSPDQVKLGSVDMDNALYRAKLTKDRQQYALPTAQEMGVPYSEFSEMVRAEMALWRSKKLLKKAELDRAACNLSNREFAWQATYAANSLAYESYNWPNRVARAVEEKHLESMLSILDGPENEASQKAVEKQYGVKLRSVTAKQRRRTLFELAGFTTDEAIAAEEARLKVLQEERKADRALRAIIERASNFKIRIDAGEVITCAEYVKTLIDRGFNTVREVKKGRATNHYLVDPATGCGYPVGRANATLDYALMLLQKQAA